MRSKSRPSTSMRDWKMGSQATISKVDLRTSCSGSKRRPSSSAPASCVVASAVRRNLSAISSPRSCCFTRASPWRASMVVSCPSPSLSASLKKVFRCVISTPMSASFSRVSGLARASRSSRGDSLASLSSSAFEKMSCSSGHILLIHAPLTLQCIILSSSPSAGAGFPSHATTRLCRLTSGGPKASWRPTANRPTDSVRHPALQ
mmetsp:Transcript_44866/g.118911  ORF Transcript_44866/g.118911 Transcript_44866/m.118911 type:complete len:204 (-) Transcript_44866:1617-2228(-)